MKPRHTTGTWQDPVVVYDDPEQSTQPICINVFGNGTDIVHTTDLRQPGLPFKTRLANARIIACAEDMRMALVAILKDPTDPVAIEAGHAAIRRTGVK